MNNTLHFHNMLWEWYNYKIFNPFHYKLIKYIILNYICQYAILDIIYHNINKAEYK